jgi:hypothetical protein
MDLKQLITHFTFRIEPKPGGGFIAHATDPSVPPLEAATREELQQKIQAQIRVALSQEFPGLKMQLDGKQPNFSFHIERKPEGGFEIHSTDPNSAPTIAANHDEVESHFAEKFLAVMGKQILPQLAPGLAAQLASGNIKVFINQKTGLTVTSGSQPALSNTQEFAGNSSPAPFQPGVTAPTFSSSSSSSGFQGPSSSVSNSEALSNTDDSPIKPEPSGSWAFLRIVFVLAVIAVIAYFFLYHR